jgi:hypothetical protein
VADPVAPWPPSRHGVSQLRECSILVGRHRDCDEIRHDDGATVNDVDDPVVTTSVLHSVLEQKLGLLRSELKGEIDAALENALEKQRQAFNEDMARYFAASQEDFRRWFGALVDKTNTTETKVAEVRDEHEAHTADDTRHRAPRRRKA